MQSIEEILLERDVATLERWFDRALSASQLSDVLS